MAADDWPRCFGRFSSRALAERELVFRKSGSELRWVIAFQPHNDWAHPWAVLAYNPYYDERSDDD
jgi:hypothetical protein